MIRAHSAAPASTPFNASNFPTPQSASPTRLFPAALLGALPLFLLFVIFQRQVVQGMTQGAVK